MSAVRKPSRTLTAVLVAGSLAASALVPAAASARVWDSDYLPIYTLTNAQKKSVCHEFTGTMTYPDGYRVDCETGNVWYSPPPQT